MTIKSSLITVGIHSAGCFVDCCSCSCGPWRLFGKNKTTTSQGHKLLTNDKSLKKTHDKRNTTIKVSK